MPEAHQQGGVGGWAPYWAPYFSFILIVMFSGRVAAPLTAIFLVLRVAVPLGLFVYYALRGAYPELRGARFGVWALADLAVGLAGAALWIAPFLVWDELRPDTRGFDTGRLGPDGVWLALTLRAIGYVCVTPFIEELFMRSWLVRYVEVAQSKRSFRNVPIARFSWMSFLVVVVFFVTTHQFWEYGVMLGWTLLTMAWFYYRKHLAPIVLVHAVTNGAIFAFVVAFDRVFHDASGSPISLWFFL